MKRNYKVFLLQFSNFTSGLANSIVMITIPWLILERTDSPAFAGLVVAISALPGLIISPIGGWLIDHVGRRAVSISADILSSLSVIAFPLFASLFGLTNLAILLIAFFGAIFDPAGYTARRTLLSDVARDTKSDLDRLNGIHEGFLGVSWIAGPAVGAWLIASVGAINSFWVSAVLFILAALSIALLRVSHVNESTNEKSEIKSDRGLRVGFVTLWRDKLLRTITIAILVIAAVYLPTESVVLPTYFENLGNPTGLGLVISALAGGSAIGAFGYGWITKRVSRRAIARFTLIGSAIAIIPMASLPPLPILIGSGFLLGLAWGPFTPLMSTLIQQRVPADQHGRVFGVQTAVFYAAPPLGMVISGLAVERFGVSTTYVGLALILSSTALLTLLTKSLRENF
ncbi:MAG: MFS transporter [Actinomycetales bacterium]